MNLFIFKDPSALAHSAAEEIARAVVEKPNAVLCLAAGDTPLKTYQHLTDLVKEKEIDFSKIHFVALDEWVGIDPSNSGSCHYFLKHSLFDPLRIAKSNQHYFDALADNMQEDCQAMNSFIAASGGIDLMLVGVGMNGHIGFNEPGVQSDLYAHVVGLDETTQNVGQKYFSRATALKQGVTLGLRHFLEARTALMIASGSRKAVIMKEALENEISPRVPASIIRTHANGMVMLDQDAASLLSTSSAF